MFYSTDPASEQAFLDRVSDRIDTQREELKKRSVFSDEYVRTSAKYLWENISGLTQNEKNFFENEINVGANSHNADIHTLKNLDAMHRSAWFGRVDFASDDETSLYIGYGTITDENGNVLVYDWRAPISSLYYDYDTGKASYLCPDGEVDGLIQRKRQYSIHERTIEKISDVEQQLPDDMLVSLLESNTSKKIKNIVRTIAKEQNRLIRDKSSRLLMIQGPAGSGKTSIALYRAAYLLYRDKMKLSADNMLILSPNDMFINYISDVLPQIGESNVSQTTFRDFTLSVISGFRHIDDVADMCEILYSAGNETRKIAYYYKNSDAFYTLLTQYIKYIEKKIANCFSPIPGILNKKEFENMFFDRFHHIPIKPRIKLIRDTVAERSAGVVSKESIHEFKKEYNAFFRRVDSRRLYLELYTDPDLFWMLGEEPEHVEDICTLVEESFKSKRLYYEDVVPMLYFKAMVDGLPEQSNIKHLLIDEAQDYNSHQLAVLRLIFPNAAMTVLGDVNQAILPGNDFSYEKVIKAFGKPDETYPLEELTKTFRSTKQINQFALSMVDEEGKIEAVDRRGARPVLLHAKDNASVFASINRHIARHNDGKTTVAVICKNEKQCRQIARHINAKLLTHAAGNFNAGEAILLPSYLAKGLEFDYVVIYDGSAENYPLEDKKLLYTICSRALHKLRIYYTDSLSPLIQKIPQELYETGEIN